MFIDRKAEIDLLNKIYVFVYPKLNKYTKRYFNGLIDEVKVYGCALTADEIQAEYNAVSPP
jgi:hypothetical protein